MAQPMESATKRPRISIIEGLTASADPVLAELWDNRKDAEYDRL